MCRPVACKQCGKTTWAGCGQHIESVKARVPAGQWCNGHADTPAASPAPAVGGLFAKIFG